MVVHILLSACKVVFFPLFSPFFLLSGDSFWGKMRKKSQNVGKGEKKTTLQADSKICPTMAPYLTFQDGHFDTSNMKIG